MEHSLRLCQGKALDKISNAGVGRYIIQMFCGTGKTLVYTTHIDRSATAAKAAKVPYTAMIVLPWLDLVEQLLNDYNMSKKFGVICFCSDVGDRGDLSTTCEKRLATFVNSKYTKPRLIITTYQSLVKCTNMLVNNKVTLQDVVYDEAHHTVRGGLTDAKGGNNTTRNRVYECPEFDALCKGKVGFFTATPAQTSDIDMSDGVRCGPSVYKYSYTEAVAAEVVTPFELRIVLCNKSTVHDDARTNISAYFVYIVRQCLSNAAGRKWFNILDYKAGVNSACDDACDQANYVKAFEKKEELLKSIWNSVCNKEYPALVGEYNVFSVIPYYGEQTQTMRKRHREYFNKTEPGRVCILTSCRTLNEGVDIPEANMVMFGHGSKSISTITQIIGRVVRRSADRTAPPPIVAIPIYLSLRELCLPDTSSPSDRLGEALCSNGEFETLLTVVASITSLQPNSDINLLKTLVHYPSKFSPQECKRSLKDQGMTVGSTRYDSLASVVGGTEGGSIKTLAIDTGQDIELYTQSFDTPIQTALCGIDEAKLVRVLKHDTGGDENDGYFLVISELSSRKKIKPPNKRVVAVGAAGLVDIHFELSIDPVESTITPSTITPRQFETALIKATRSAVSTIAEREKKAQAAEREKKAQAAKKKKSQAKMEKAQAKMEKAQAKITKESQAAKKKKAKKAQALYNKFGENIFASSDITNVIAKEAGLGDNGGKTTNRTLQRDLTEYELDEFVHTHTIWPYTFQVKSDPSKLIQFAE